jgi:hypothetical protein
MNTATIELGCGTPERARTSMMAGRLSFIVMSP